MENKEQNKKIELNIEVEATKGEKIATIIFFSLLFFLIAYFIYGKIMLVIRPIPEAPKDYSIYNWYFIPVIYIIDYFKHAWNSLFLAFILAGIIHEFIPQDAIKRVLGSGRFRDYIFAAALAPVFVTCSCSVIPVYVGILMSGASIGVVMTFFLMAPAANFITIMMTGEYIGWNIGIWRLAFSFIAAVLSGYLFDRLKVAKKLSTKYDMQLQAEIQSKRINIKKTIHHRVKAAYEFSWTIVKQIVPLLLLGLAIVSYLAAYLPEEWVSLYFTGFAGIVIAALLGGPLYTPTLVEIVLTKALLAKGMTGPVALSFLMGQPYDVVSMVPNSRYFTWKGVLLYFIVFFVFSIISALLYGLVA
ncbi:MAG: permease [Promethearchaeota archaeon]